MTSNDTDRKRSRFPWLWMSLVAAVGVSVLLTATFLILAGQAYDALKPPADAQTLGKFADRMPPPQRLATIEIEGAAYFVWIGEQDEMFPGSGPPGYVFDQEGALVDYSLDTGDDHHISRYLSPAWDAPAITVEEAVNLIAEGT